jgi:phage protein D
MAETQNLLNQVYLEIAGMGADRATDLLGTLVTLTVESSLHLPDVATLIIHDPSLQWVDDAALEPGKALKISAKTGDSDHPIFDGEIVGLEPEYTVDAPRLVIRAFDRLHRLSRGRKTRSFVNVTDGDVVQKLAGEVGLRAEVGPANAVHKYLFQNNETNLEFMRARAAALGFVIYVEGTVLHFKEPKADADPVELQWAASLTEFRPSLTTIDQVNGTVVRGWDPDKRQEIVGRASGGNGTPEIGQSKKGGDLAKAAFSIDASTLSAHVPVREQGRADSMAKALAERHLNRFVEAEGTCMGNPKIVAGTPVKISAVGDRFSGTYVVTSCRHEYRLDKTFLTHFSVSGQNQSTLLSVLTSTGSPSTTRGLAIAVVTDNQDPDGLGRVKLTFPWLAPDQASDWVRVAIVGGGPERGIAFLPEINDEVLVGFEHGDIHFPYVLGGLWNGVDKPAVDTNKAITGGKVQLRVIKSRVGHHITIDDTDGGGGITIADKSGNTVAVDTASNSLKVKVQGDVKMEATGNFKVEATGSVEIKGLGVKIDGGGGMVEVKGTMVNLN